MDYMMDYFEAYENLNVHKCMLEDTVRNRAYKEAILGNKDSFKGKIVLDVGAGTGILSVFCAQAGAAKVYAVEASNTYKIAEEIVKENNVENVVKVIHSKVEDLVLPNDEKVHIIVSEWMGHYLFHEGMLDSVIFARNKFLYPQGIIYPESVELFACPCSLNGFSVPSLNDYWINVDGVSMRSFGNKLKDSSTKEPLLIQVSPDDLLCEPEPILWMDLYETTTEYLNVINFSHVFSATKQGRYQGICLWFSCSFPSYSNNPVKLSTSPKDPKTHWVQTVISLPVNEDVEVGTPLAFNIVLKRVTESSRKYSLEVTLLDPQNVEHEENCGCHMTKCILTKAVLEKYNQGDFSKK